MDDAHGSWMVGATTLGAQSVMANLADQIGGALAPAALQELEVPSHLPSYLLYTRTCTHFLYTYLEVGYGVSTLNVSTWKSPQSILTAHPQ